MSSRRALERTLADLTGFDEPRAALEQYPTPADVAAHLVHLADLQGDLDGIAVDLGTGTGVLALGARVRGAQRVVGIERDPAALETAVENEATLAAREPRLRRRSVDWVISDVARVPLHVDPEERDGVTVVMNPPFGAQDDNVHADRRFLQTARTLCRVSYSIHNAGSRSFVESFATDHGGTVTHAFAVDLVVDRQFAFHEADRETIDAEAYRIEWDE